MAPDFYYGTRVLWGVVPGGEQYVDWQQKEEIINHPERWERQTCLKC